VTKPTKLSVFDQRAK